MKILIVDNAEDSRPVVDLLEQTPGNNIRSVESGGAALQACQQWGGVDLLITEVFLEPMNGFTLRNKLENRFPGVRTIFLSSYDLSAYAEHTAGAEIVAKPMSAATLFPAIARATAPPPPPPEPIPEPVEFQHTALEPFAAPTQTQLPLEQPEAVPSEFASGIPIVPAPAAVPVPVRPAVPVRPVEAVPSAVPKIATPRAVSPGPAAVPVATPRPGAQPTVVPRATVPTAVPQPATPTAVPRPATPSATPGAVPRAAVATAVPRPASPGAVPRPAGTPSATPRPGVPTATAKSAVPVDPLIGQTLGSYRIESRLGSGKWGTVYRAIQTSMDRPVAMEVLSADRQNNEIARQEFVATARAKAAVQHPHILSVYEADQAGGHFFYTHEYVDGSTLAQLARRGEGLTEATALQTIKFVAQALANLHHQKVPHSVPDASDIFIGNDGLPHLSNVAQSTEGIPVVQEEIRALGAVVRASLPGSVAQDRGLQALFTRMGLTGNPGFQSWPALFQAIQAIEPKVVPADAFKLSAQDQAAINAVELARKREKRQVIYSIVSLVFLVCLAAWLVWWKFVKPAVPDYSNDMVEIPAGEFIYQDGQKTSLPNTYWIDRYEVTLADYAKFLAYVKSHDNTTEFDSPTQPAGLSHIPSNWDIFYGHASSSFSGYHTVRGSPLTLDCPVFNVNYYDAFAYAKWKGRRLPTQQEWEAARGTAGLAYPWGNEWNPKNTNTGGDWKELIPPDYKPGVDGFTWWAPVTAIPADKSPFGVIGMAGNVSEWTDSWDASHQHPIIRGGNFKSKPEQAKTTAHLDNAEPTTIAESLGFRTVSDKPPGK